MVLRITAASLKQLSPGLAGRVRAQHGHLLAKTCKRSPGVRRRGDPQSVLWGAVHQKYSDAMLEFAGAVPGRRYRIDIAIPATKLAIEIDGWEWHGKHKGDFTRDRERQNLLVLNGWRVLRFTAKQIHRDLSGCMSAIEAAREAV